MFKNLDLRNTYVLQEVSTPSSNDDRDYDAEMEEAMDALYGPQALNLGAANIRWNGESQAQRNSYVENRKHDNGVNCFDIAVDGPEVLVFTQENAHGKLVRLWIDRDTNVTARIRYAKSHVAYRLEIFRNKRTNGRWHGVPLVEHYVHRTVTNEAELTVAKYVAVYFQRFM